MNEKLLAQRTNLSAAYSKTNEAVAKAKVACADASKAVQEFDKANPEVMREAHERAGAIKKAERAEEIALAAELEAEEGVTE